MIYMCTTRIPQHEVVFPRLLCGDLKSSQACCQCSQAGRRHSQTCRQRYKFLPGLSSLLPGLLLVHLKATVSVQSSLGFDHPWILVRQHSNTPRGPQRHNYILLMLVYAARGVCCTQCFVYLVNAELSVNLSSLNREIKRENITLCSLVMVVWSMGKTEIRGDGGTIHEKLGLKRMSCVIQSSIPSLTGITLNSVRNNTDTRSPKPNWAGHTPDFSCLHISPISFPYSSPISVSRVQLYRHRRMQSQIIPLSLHPMGMS